MSQFATLKQALSNWYHQDAFVNFSSHNEIWCDLRDSYAPDSRKRLAAEIRKLLERSDSEIVALWNASTDYRFAQNVQIRHFLAELAAYLEGGAERL
jgi:hypothetical protein